MSLFLSSDNYRSSSSNSENRSEWIQDLASVQDDSALISAFYSQHKYIQNFGILQNGIKVIRKKEGIYFGNASETGQREGLGIMCYFNGRIYEGEWKNGIKHGKGAELYQNEGKYFGSFQDGKRSGKGQFQWANGEVYDGEWKDGQKNGSGLWRGKKGDSYIGEWKEGRADGFGVHTWINGDRYEGQFKMCLKDGFGTDKFGNGDSYTGNYMKGKPEGYGEYLWSNGNSYKGEFMNGLRHGQGIWISSISMGGDQYEGGYYFDKKNGYGQYKWHNGTIFKGNFENDLRHGYGEMQNINGNLDKGFWKQGFIVEKFNEQTTDDDTTTGHAQTQTYEDDIQNQEVFLLLPKYPKKSIRYNSNHAGRSHDNTLPHITRTNTQYSPQFSKNPIPFKRAKSVVKDRSQNKHQQLQQDVSPLRKQKQDASLDQIYSESLYRPNRTFVSKSRSNSQQQQYQLYQLKKQEQQQQQQMNATMHIVKNPDQISEILNKFNQMSIDKRDMMKVTISPKWNQQSIKGKLFQL